MQRYPADREAWEEFVRRYQPMIRAWCVKWGLQSSDADDVAQDVLIKLLNAMRHFRYDPSRSFCACLRTVTQSALSDFAAGRGKEPGQLLPEITIADRVDARAELERELEGLYDRDMFQMAMWRIDKRQAHHLGRLPTHGAGGPLRAGGRPAVDHARGPCLRGQESRPEAPPGRDPPHKRA